MSLDIYYTSSGTIIVTCGGVKTELTALPAGSTLSIPSTAETVSSGTNTPTPVDTPQQPQTVPATTHPEKPVTRDRLITRPSEGPGVMIIRPVEDEDADTDATENYFELPIMDLDAFRQYRIEGIVQLVHEVLNRQTTRRARKALLDVKVSVDQMKIGINTAEFESMLDGGANGIGAIRIVLPGKSDLIKR